MIFRPHYYDDSGCAVYLFGCGTRRVAVVVDPRRVRSRSSGRWNPMLSMSRDAFIDALSNVPTKPEDIEQILAVHRGGHAAAVGR